MTFETTKRINEWCEKHIENGCRSTATAGEQFEFTFTPSGIVEYQTVKCLRCGENMQII